MVPKYLRALLALIAVSVPVAFGATSAVASNYPNPRFEPSIPPATIYYGIKSGQVTLETTGAFTLKCGSVSGEGQYVEGFDGYRTIATGLTFKNCISNLLVKCTSSGAQAGEITTKQLDWDLAILNKEREEAGLVMNENPAKPEGGQTFAIFKCGTSTNYTLSGSTLGKITPVNGVFEPSFSIEVTGKKGVPGLSKYIREPQSETEKRIEGTTSLNVSGPYNGKADLTVSKLEMDVEAWKIEF